jgi:hypothetical protein
MIMSVGTSAILPTTEPVSGSIWISEGVIVKVLVATSRIPMSEPISP